MQGLLGIHFKYCCSDINTSHNGVYANVAMNMHQKYKKIQDIETCHAQRKADTLCTLETVH